MLLLVYSVTLLVAVLLSERFNRTVLSAAVLFLVVGYLSGPALAGIVSLSPGDRLVEELSDLALVTILFTDALRLGWNDLRHTWTLPGRALFFGLPLTIAGMAVAGHALLGLDWKEALLVGAILSPTDPVFASAIVGREEIPLRLRRLLNVESGLNDGLALPIVIVMLATASGASTDVFSAVEQAAAGIAFGAAVGYVAGRLAGIARVRRVGIRSADPWVRGAAHHLRCRNRAAAQRLPGVVQRRGRARVRLPGGGRGLSHVWRKRLATPQTGGGTHLRGDAERREP